MAEQIPDTEWGKRAAYRISVALLNMRQKSDGIAALNDYAEAYPKSDDIPYIRYQIGCVYSRMGAKGYAKAVESFRGVIKAYPTHHHARNARMKLAMLNRRMAAELGDMVN